MATSPANSPAPVTPPRHTEPDAALKSTPGQGLGSASAAISDSFTRLDVADVSPWIAYDLQNHAQCDFLVLLKVLLRRCEGAKSPKDDDALLDECIEAVLPICNQRGDGTIRESLDEYLLPKKHETEYYSPFVNTFNRALQKMREDKTLKIPLGPIDPDGLEVMFCRSDPKVLVGTHDGIQSKRKPDVVLVAHGPAFRVAGDSEKRTAAQWDELAFTWARTASEAAFGWADCLSCQEFKRRIRDRALDPPPLEYTNEFRSQIPHLNRVDQEWPFDEPTAPQPPEDSAAAAEASSSEPQHLDVPASTSAAPGSMPRRSARLNTTTPASDPTLVDESTRKRKSKASHPAGGSVKKLKVDDTTKDPPIVVQSGLYAAEMLMRGPYATHAINLVINDHYAWVWWYDRQGAIQSSGIDFVLDLPYFLVLLAVFQRFSLKDWGIERELFQDAELHHKRATTDTPSGRNVLADGLHPRRDLNSFTFCCDNMVEAEVYRNSPIYQRFSLLGRGTSIYRATQKVTGGQNTGQNTPGQTTSGSEQNPPVDLVIKIYWPEIERESEVGIIELATKKGEHDELVKEHIPVVVGSRDVSYSTGTIRDEIRSERLRLTTRHHVSGPRLLRVLLMRKLEPMQKLHGSEFLQVWIDCYRCHFRLWLHGIEHTDISLHNLMYNPSTKRGVLNDFDLAVIRDGSDRKPTGKERTGTIPFMSLDLLCKKYYDGKIARQYRHDLESFIWILPYTLLRGYNKEQDALLDAWNTGDYNVCYVEKSAFLSRFAKQVPSDRNRQVWDSVGFGCMLWFRDEFFKLDGLQIRMARYKVILQASDRTFVDRWESESIESAGEILKEFDEVIARELTSSSVSGFDFIPLTDTQMHL